MFPVWSGGRGLGNHSVGNDEHIWVANVHRWFIFNIFVCSFKLLMGIFFFTENVALVEDIPLNDTYHDAQSLQKDMQQGYRQVIKEQKVIKDSICNSCQPDLCWNNLYLLLYRNGCLLLYHWIRYNSSLILIKLGYLFISQSRYLTLYSLHFT